MDNKKISRYWSGRIKKGQEQNYIKYLKEEIIPHLRSLEGFEKASIQKRQLDQAVEFLFISRWRSLEDIRAFSGEDLNQAVVAEKAQAMMLDFDQEVRHYELVG